MCFPSAVPGPLTGSGATEDTILLRATVDLYGVRDNFLTAGSKVSCGREAFLQFTLSYRMNLQRTPSVDDIESLILRLFCKSEATNVLLAHCSHPHRSP